MKNSRGRSAIGLFILTGCLTGCNPFMPFRPDSEELVKKGWARQPQDQADPKPIYCYNTLARKDCYTVPLDDQSRLSGYYGPKP